MPIQAAAAVALGGAAETTSTVSGQVSKQTDAAQCLLSQSQTGKNPSLKINPPEKNDPSKYGEDDESIARGSMVWISKILENSRKTIEEAHNTTAKKVAETMIDPSIIVPVPMKPGLLDRLGKLFKEISRIALSATLQKDQGNTVKKNAEVLVNLSKVTHNQAGSVLHDEAPFILHSARAIVNRGATQLSEVGDDYVVADTIQRRVNHYIITAGKVSQIVSADYVVASSGNYKFIQNLLSVGMLFQAGKDFVVQTIAGAIKLMSTTTMSLQSQAGTTISSSGPVKLESASTIDISAAAINITAAGIINLGAGAPGTPPVPPIPDTVVPQVVPDRLPTAVDTKPGLLVESKPGTNPPGAVPPRVDKNNKPNR